MDQMAALQARMRLDAAADGLRATVVRASGNGVNPHGTPIRVSSRQDVLAASEQVAAAPVVWTDDGWCMGRAMIGAHLVNERLGWQAAGASDAARAGIALQVAGDRLLADRWTFHVAPAMRTPDGTVVLDPVLADRPVSLGAWQARMGAGHLEAELIGPLELHNHGRRALTVDDVDGYTEHLLDTWRSMRVRDGQVHVPELDPGSGTGSLLSRLAARPREWLGLR